MTNTEHNKINRKLLKIKKLQTTHEKRLLDELNALGKLVRGKNQGKSGQLLIQMAKKTGVASNVALFAEALYLLPTGLNLIKERINAGASLCSIFEKSLAFEKDREIIQKLKLFVSHHSYLRLYTDSYIDLEYEKMDPWHLMNSLNTELNRLVDHIDAITNNLKKFPKEKVIVNQDKFKEGQAKNCGIVDLLVEKLSQFMEVFEEIRKIQV